MTRSAVPVVDQPGATLALDLFVLHQHLGALLDEALHGTGVSPAQYAVYSQLGRGASSPKLLLDVLGLRPGTLSGYLAAMEDRGHLVRSRAATDRRGHRLELTEQGRATLDSCRTRFGRAVRAMEARLGGPEDVTHLRLVLGDLDAAIRSAHDEVSAGR